MAEFLLVINDLRALPNTVSQDTSVLPAMVFLWAPPYMKREIDIFDRNKTKVDIVVNRLYAEYNREHALKFGSAADGVRRKFVLQHFFFKIFEKRCGCR